RAGTRGPATRRAGRRTRRRPGPRRPPPLASGSGRAGLCRLAAPSGTAPRLGRPGGERRLVDGRCAPAVVVGGRHGRASRGRRPVASPDGGCDGGGSLRGESAFADQSFDGCGELTERFRVSAVAAPGTEDVQGCVDRYAAVQEIRQGVNGQGDRLARGGSAVERTNGFLRHATP